MNKNKAMKYKLGDALDFDGYDVLIHQANCMNVMGSGIARQIRMTHPEAYNADTQMSEYLTPEEKFGNYSCSNLISDNSKMIVNMYSQLGFSNRNHGKPDTDYQAMEKAARKIVSDLSGRRFAVPYLIGCDLGGGKWEFVHNILEDVFKNEDLTVVVWNKLYNKIPDEYAHYAVSSV